MMSRLSPQANMILKRIAWYGVAFFLVISLTFFLPYFGYSGSTKILDQSQLTDANFAAIQQEFRTAFHLDEPLVFQYVRFIGQTISGDLGISEAHYPQKNSEFIGKALLASLAIILPAFIVGWLAGFFQGALFGFQVGLLRRLSKMWAYSCFLASFILLARVDFTNSLIAMWQPMLALTLLIWGYQVLQTQNRIERHQASPLQSYMESLGIQPWRLQRRILLLTLNQGVSKQALRPLGFLCIASLSVELLFHYNGIATLLQTAINTHNISMVRAVIFTIVGILLLVSFFLDSIGNSEV